MTLFMTPSALFAQGGEWRLSAPSTKVRGADFSRCAPGYSTEQIPTVSEVQKLYQTTLEGHPLFAISVGFESAQKALGPKSQMTVGTEVRIMRCLAPGRWEVMGVGRISDINGGVLVGMAEGPSVPDMPPWSLDGRLVQTGNLHWQPMAGDAIFPANRSVQVVARIAPRLELDAQDLFVQLNSGGVLYALTDAGRALLREKYRLLTGLSGRIVVEGFSRTPGERENLRKMTLQMAQSVAQFLRHEFGLTEAQVVAVGIGADTLDPTLRTQLPAWPDEEIRQGVLIHVISR